MSGDSFYCPLAWGSVALRNNGDFRLCCHANVSESSGILRDPKGIPLNIAKVSIAEAQNHPDLQEARREFLQGNWPKACVRCKTEEESGLKSGRSHALQRVKNEKMEEEFLARLQQTSADGYLSEAAIVEMDIRFGNYCNLKCRSCGPTDSSAWYRDWKQLGNSEFLDSGISVKLVDDGSSVRAEPNRFQWIENTSADSLIPENAKMLKRIYMAGGEPLLIAKHTEFLQGLVDRDLAQQIYLEYNTNLTVLPETVLQLWKKFKTVGVGISLDGVGKFHEYLRFPAKQKILEKNLALLDEQPANLRAWFACTVSWMNFSHIPDYLFWISAQNFRKLGKKRNDRLPISFHLLHKPMHLNLQGLPEKAKRFLEKRCLERWLEIKSNFSQREQELAEDFYAKVIRYMKKKDHSENWPKYLEKNRQLDLLRGQSFYEIDPELAEILGYSMEKFEPALEPENLRAPT